MTIKLLPARSPASLHDFPLLANVRNRAQARRPVYSPCRSTVEEGSMVSAGSRFLSFAALAALLYGIPVDAQTGRISGVVRSARGADNIEAIAANVAGLAVQNLGPGQSQPAIRGASSGQIARDQPGVKEEVGAYLDEVPISLSLFTPDLDLFDVSRVEVLRGPQGTLFGSGSLGGTVRYISNQPELGESSTFGEVGGSAIDRGAPGSSAKLGFNVPMGDKVAFRVAGYSNRLPGYMDAVQPNLRINQDVNGGERTGVRAAFRIVPSQRFSVTPRIVYQDVKMDGWN